MNGTKEGKANFATDVERKTTNSPIVPGQPTTVAATAGSKATFDRPASRQPPTIHKVSKRKTPNSWPRT